MLSIQNITKTFGKRTALSQVSFAFDKKVYGLVGANGAGKTTLLRCILQLYRVKDGEVLWNGKSVARDRSFLNQVGYLPQQFGLYKELRVREALALLANEKGVPKQDTDERIAACLALVHLSDRADSKVGELSGGMVRRLGIAQTLLNEPQLLIFDEPTAGLDPEERVRFQNIITNIKKDRTVILSTHIVADIQAVCDEVLILGEGKLLFHGTVRDMTEQARGKVFLAKQADMTGSDVFIVKTEEKDGEVTLRYLAPENRGGSPCEPTAEDGYLCIQKQI